MENVIRKNPKSPGKSPESQEASEFLRILKPDSFVFRTILYKAKGSTKEYKEPELRRFVL